MRQNPKPLKNLINILLYKQLSFLLNVITDSLSRCLFFYQVIKIP